MMTDMKVAGDGDVHNDSEGDGVTVMVAVGE